MSSLCTARLTGSLSGSGWNGLPAARRLRGWLGPWQHPPSPGAIPTGLFIVESLLGEMSYKQYGNSLKGTLKETGAGLLRGFSPRRGAEHAAHFLWIGGRQTACVVLTEVGPGGLHVF